MRRYYLHIRNGLYYAELVDPVTKRKLTARCTGTANRDEAATIVGQWLSEGIPAVKGKTKKTIKEAVDYAAVKGYIHTGNISEAEAVELVNLLRSRGLVKINAAETTKGKIDFIAYLKNFYDYNNSLYVKEKRAHGQSIGRRYCEMQSAKVDQFWKPHFEGRELASIYTARVKRVFA